MPINGQTYDWESITTTISGLILDGIQEITYKDEKDKEPIYGRGNVPIAYGSGKYKASGKLSLLKTEYNKIKNIALPFGGLYKLPPFPITVSYKNEDQPMTTDILPDCSITSIDRKGKQGDKELIVDVEFIILSQIVEA